MANQQSNGQNDANNGLKPKPQSEFKSHREFEKYTNDYNHAKKQAEKK